MAEVTTPPSGEVVIAGRTFTLRAVYAPRLGRGHGRKKRRLLRYIADSPLPGGRVVVAIMPMSRRQVMAGTEWAAWAGEMVEDSLEDVGR